MNEYRKQKFKDNRLLFQLLNFVQKSILCAKLTTCEKKKLFKTSSKSIYSPVNFIGPDSVTDTDLRLNCRIPVSNCKQNLHYARNSDLKLCAMWHLKINGNAVDIILLYNTSQKIIGFISNILQRY